MRNRLTGEQRAARAAREQAAWDEAKARRASCRNPETAEVWVGSAIEPAMRPRPAVEFRGVLTVVAVCVWASAADEAAERLASWHAGERGAIWIC